MPERCKPESSGCSFDTKDISEFDVNIVCEKLMGKDRTDIFAEISDGDKTVATIMIENKIWSEEHDNQTVSV